MSESRTSQKKKPAVDAEDAGGRHRGREVALQVLYSIDLRETGARVAAASRAAKPSIRCSRNLNCRLCRWMLPRQIQLRRVGSPSIV